MTDKTYTTKSGKTLTDADIEQPAEVVPVRLDPELRAAVEARATADQTTTNDVIREAQRRLLDVA